MQSVMEDIIKEPLEKTSGAALGELLTALIMKALSARPVLAFYLADTDLYHYACLAHARHRGFDPVEFEKFFRGSLEMVDPFDPDEDTE